jgi:leucyl aminopeptidase (aminopeptidase T)
MNVVGYHSVTRPCHTLFPLSANGVMEGDDVWNYQIGRDPGAVLLFTDGKVVDVSEWRK